MRLHALVGDRRNPEPALRRHDRAVDVTIADLSARLQQFGHRLQERIPVPHSQRASRLEDSGELCVGEADRPHACLPRAAFRGKCTGPHVTTLFGRVAISSIHTHGPNTNVVLRARDAQKLVQVKRAVEEMLERVRRDVP
jgi:hypothetical protein